MKAVGGTGRQATDTKQTQGSRMRRMCIRTQRNTAVKCSVTIVLLNLCGYNRS